MRGWKSVSILIAASVTSQTTQPFMKRQISLRIKLNSICKRAKKLIILDFRIDHPTACILKGMEFKHRVSPNKFSPQALPSENLKKSANLDVDIFGEKIRQTEVGIKSK